MNMNPPANLQFGNTNHDYANLSSGHLVLTNDNGDEVTITRGLLQRLGLVGEIKACTCPEWAVVHPRNAHVKSCPRATGTPRDLEG